MGEREGPGADREDAGAAAPGSAQGGERRLGRRRQDPDVAGDDDGVGPPQGAEPGLGRIPKPLVVRTSAPLIEQVEKA